MPGIGLVIDGAMQQAPHAERQAGLGDSAEEAGGATGIPRLSSLVAICG